MFILTNLNSNKSSTKTISEILTKTPPRRGGLRFLDPKAIWRGQDFNLENYLNHKTEKSLESILIEEIKKPVKLINKGSSKNTDIQSSSLTLHKILNNAIKNENKFPEFRNIEVTQIL